MTSNETKKRSATFVYPNAALFASIAAPLFRSAMVGCAAAILLGGGTSELGRLEAGPMVTEY